MIIKVINNVRMINYKRNLQEDKNLKNSYKAVKNNSKAGIAALYLVYRSYSRKHLMALSYSMIIGRYFVALICSIIMTFYYG